MSLPLNDAAGRPMFEEVKRISNRLVECNDRWLITPKLMYFTMNMVVYTFHLFRAPFITGYLDLDRQYVGLTSTLMSVVAFPSVTMWSTVADRLGRHKLVLSLITFGMVACFELLLIRFDVYQLRLAYSIGMLMLYNCFLVGMQPLLDFEALDLLSSKPGFNKEMYGRQRLWGTIAFTVITLGGAIMMGYFGGFWVLFIIMPVMAVIFVVTLYFTAPPDKPNSLWGRKKPPTGEMELPAGDDEKLQTHAAATAKLSAMTDTNNTSSIPHLITKKVDSAVDIGQPQIGAEGFSHKKVRDRWRTLLTDPNYMFFLFVILMLGLARSVMTTFLALFWIQGLKMSGTEVAYAGAIFGMLLEIAVFFVAKPIAARIGNYWMLVMAQMAMVCRCWAYYWIPEGHGMYWAVYLIELLKGLSFGMAHSAAIKIANEAAPEGLEATAQALYNSVYVQLPTVISGLAGMWAFRRFQNDAPKIMFFGTAVVSSFALVLFVTKYSIEGKIRIKFWNRRALIA